MNDDTYTESASVDIIKDYILSKNEIIKTIQHLGSVCRGKFLFNPSETNEKIVDIFLKYPDDFKFIVRRVLGELVAEFFDDERAVAVVNNVPVVISTNNIIKMHDWSSDYEGIPVSTRCQIVGSLKEETYTKNAECYCTLCHRRMPLVNQELPVVCENANCKSRKFALDRNTLKTGDIKTIIIQEPMDEIKHGMPKLMTCVVKDDLVFDSYPGQRKFLTGVFHSTPKKGSDRNNIVIHAISMENIDEENLKLPDDDKKERYRKLAESSDYLKLLTNSFAPEIKFRELEKLGIIIGRVGSNAKGRLRGRIPVLLIGPPATGKSKILEFTPEVTQRCGYAVGGMATGAGITVTMTTLPDKTKFPKGGIVVQCSGSCVVLDELNQFPPEDIEKTYTSMESGKIPYNKGGFDQIFTAETTILAGANPKNGYYVTELGMTKNLNLPVPMISRFDIIINVLPEASETESNQISQHTYEIQAIGVDEYIRKNNLLTSEEMLELFNYATTIEVTVTPEATSIIDDYTKTILKIQNTGDQIDGAKQFDRRFIESVLRVAEALTRLHLKTEITKEFAMMAIDYINKTLQTFGLKTELGTTQIPMEEQDTKDLNKAFEKTWIKMCKDADTELLPEYDFLKFLTSEYPELFPSTEKGEKLFKLKEAKGELIHQSGRYRMVR